MKKLQISMLGIGVFAVPLFCAVQLPTPGQVGTYSGKAKVISFDHTSGKRTVSKRDVRIIVFANGDLNAYKGAYIEDASLTTFNTFFSPSTGMMHADMFDRFSSVQIEFKSNNKIHGIMLTSVKLANGYTAIARFKLKKEQ